MAFFLDLTRYLLPQLTESLLDHILHKVLLERLKANQQSNTAMNIYDKALQESGLLLVASLFDEPIKFSALISRFWHPFLNHLLKLVSESIYSQLAIALFTISNEGNNLFNPWIIHAF